MSSIWVILILVFFVSVVSIRLFGRLALNGRFLDKPNHRSTHTSATPSSGGIVLAFVCVIAIEHTNTQLSFCLVAGLFAALGIVDDVYDLNAKAKLLCHFLFVFLFVRSSGLSGFDFELYGTQVTFEGIWIFVPICLAVWIVNSHNFMDGVDGIATIESIFVFSTGGLSLYFFGFIEWGFACAVLGIGCAAFLLSNFPPARIFMGDSGSYFLGFCIAGFMLLSWFADDRFVWLWLILYACFLVDTTVTLVKRLLSGENCFEAHRKHLYQQLSDRCGVKRVLFFLLAINIFWLLPLSCLLVLTSTEPIILFLIAYSPLCIIHLIIGGNLRIDAPTFSLVGLRGRKGSLRSSN